MAPLSLAFSPCPNDTFIFHALVHGLVPGPDFAPPVLEDVETLNRWALDGRFQVTKLSFHALGRCQDRYAMLASGAALGRGCGPLVVAREPVEPGRLAGMRVAVPGELTTAALLLRLFAPDCVRTRVLRFERIMPAVAAGEVDAGVIIHESRFTYGAHGLHAVVDLGQWWEESTGLPIPLGCIAARRDLGRDLIASVDAAIRASLLHARQHPGAADSYVRAHAQEMDPQVMAGHISLYVNDYSLDMGPEGRAAVQEMLRRGQEAGLFARDRNGA